VIIKADSRYIPLLDKSVNAIITSPPYWSLRKYDIPDLIWDGMVGKVEKCKHSWVDGGGGLLHENRNFHPGTQEEVKGSGPLVKVQEERKGNDQFCEFCGAWKGQLGLEPTIDLYLKHLLQIMDECKRVLRDDGTMWVNLGDSYSTAKSLCGIPERFVIAMTDRGWIRRNTIIWHKPNCMPSSAKDRFTVDFEPVFFFVKSNDIQYWTNEKTGQLVSKQPTKGIEGEDWEWREVGRSAEEEDELQRIIEERGITRQSAGREVKIENCKGKMKKVSFWSGHDYWFEQQYESHLQSSIDRMNYKWDGNRERQSTQNPQTLNIKQMCGSQGRNRRCVWTISTQPYPESHFATFPEALVEPMIKAGCPQFVCKKCGKPRVKIYEPNSGGTIGHSWHPHEDDLMEGNVKTQSGNEYKTYKKGCLVGLTDCGCNAGFEGGIVLDPFCGSGTVGKVCNHLFDMHIKFVGLDLGYQDLGKKRTRKVGLYY
jgi:DNA modification methylase